MIDLDLCSELKTTITWIELSPIIECLRNERIKQNTDYSIMLKYNKVYVQCHSVYTDIICDAFKYYGVEITKLTEF